MGKLLRRPLIVVRTTRLLGAHGRELLQRHARRNVGRRICRPRARNADGARDEYGARPRRAARLDLQPFSLAATRTDHRARDGRLLPRPPERRDVRRATCGTNDAALIGMADQTHRIVVALDLEEYAEIVLEHALDQATRHVAPDLHFLMVVEDSKTDIEEVKRRFAALVLPALEGRDRTNWRVRLTVRTGKAPEEITNLAADIRAHLIVIGRFGVHHPHRRIGLTASRVIDLATCPTFVVVPSDQTPDSQPACPECVALRSASDGRIWFCPAHSAPGSLHLSTIVGTAPSFTDGGLMW